MSGLHIQQRADFHVIRWSIAIIATLIVVLTIYFGIRWYNTGLIPPIPFPIASASMPGDDKKVTRDQLASYSVDNTMPKYIEAASIDLAKTRVFKVGLTENKLLATPKNVNDTGWYEKSAFPGSEAGAVLINGRTKGATSTGAFAKIGSLSLGDEVTITRGDNKRYSYEIVDVQTMPVEQAVKSAMKTMMQSAEPAKEGLSLVAETGNWIPKSKVFDSRVMVRGVAK